MNPTKKRSPSQLGPLRGGALALGLHLAFASSLSGGLAGCGDDDEDSPPPAPVSTPVAAAAPRVVQPGAARGAAGSAGARGPLTTYTHVEDLMPTEAERATIRHQFRESDFTQASDGDNRDPFRSYLLDPGIFDQPSASEGAITEMCTAKQLVATSYSVRDLRLVGIVSRGLKRYALMQDSANVGQIVTRGDCLGKEKARVKEIGAGYLTLEVKPEGAAPGTAVVAQERSIPLYPEELPMNRNTDEEAALPPVILPPQMPSSSGAAVPSGGAGGATRPGNAGNPGGNATGGGSAPNGAFAGDGTTGAGAAERLPSAPAPAPIPAAPPGRGGGGSVNTPSPTSPNAPAPRSPNAPASRPSGSAGAPIIPPS